MLEDTPMTLMVVRRAVSSHPFLDEIILAQRASGHVAYQATDPVPPSLLRRSLADSPSIPRFNVLLLESLTSLPAPFLTSNWTLAIRFDPSWADATLTPEGARTLLLHVRKQLKLQSNRR